MSVMVLVEVKLKDDKTEEFESYIASIIGDTRGYDGCNSMRFNVNQDDKTNVLFVESWESREKYEEYFAWRGETGVLDKLGPMLAAEPNLRFFDDVGM